VIDRLAEHRVPRNVLELVKNILQENTVTIEDGVAKHEGVTQTNEFVQGDNLSPLLFSILVADLPSKLKTRHPNVEVIMYADDLVEQRRCRNCSMTLRNVKDPLNSLMSG